MRIAAIDIGTNSIHMLIAEAHATSGFDVIDREREVVQVGRGSFGAARLRPGAIQRTVAALERFVQLARRRQVDHILCTATAAVREARNGGEFLARAREVAGITPRVIPATEEGRLIYRAITSALELDVAPALIVDIGGGSMQLVVGNCDRLIEVVSAPVGALRLTERLDGHDPLSRHDLTRLRRLVRRGTRDALEAVLRHRPARVVGASGSIHALAHVAAARETGEPLEHLNGAVLSREALRATRRALQRMTLAERERLPGIDAQRAEIIVPGAVVLEHVLDAVGAESITLSDFGVREGLVVDYVANHAAEVSVTEEVSDLRRRSVLHALARFQSPLPHAQHITRLALELFDGLARDHGLGPEARERLEHAAMLHDVGAVVGYDQHGAHSYYLVKNANLRGFTADELERIAAIARFHGKARPRKRVPEYAALPRDARREVQWLSAILSVAEALDRSHYQLVRRVRITRGNRGIALHAQVKRDARLELWAAAGRTARLERLLDRPVRIRPERAVESAKPSAAAAPAEPPAAKRTARIVELKR